MTFSLELNTSVSNSISIAVTIDRSDFKPQWNRLRIVKRGVGDIEVEASCFREYTKFFIRLR